MYKWIHYCPLTASEAVRAFKKGINVYAIGCGEDFLVTRRQEIRQHSKRGGMFAADRDVVIQSETHFIAHYAILVNNKETDKAIMVKKKYKNRSELQDDCMNLLTKTMRKHGVLEDGTYQAMLEIERYLFGEFERTDDYDEGEIVMQNGAVTRVPSGFWLPF